MKKTKIIATIGPASLDCKVFNNLIKEGVDYIRINTAYSNKEQHKTIFENLEKCSNKNVEIMFDVRSTDKLEKIADCNPTLIALSFTESAKEVKTVLKRFPNAKVVSKIESIKGIQNFEEILNASYGIMVARGDLGIAVSLEKVPCLQRNLSKKTLKANKFLIIATEMLLSMTKNKKPTRAEVSDVANAVFDGASAVMLSEETAIGENPVEAVSFMRKIIEDAENCI